MAVTTYHGGTSKSFTWSYSRLKNFETCPKRHWHIDIQRDIKEEESESLQWGNAVHKALALRLSKGTPLPIGMEPFEAICARVLTGGGNILVEQKLAITRTFGPTEYFAKDVWFRGVADLIKIVGPVALIIDWKTGKLIEDSHQLALNAACVFAHFPEVKKIRSEFFWLKDNASTRDDFTREDIVKVWKSLLPRVDQLEHAHSTTSYPAKPGKLCRNWCPVTVCPHHGE